MERKSPPSSVIAPRYSPSTSRGSVTATFHSEPSGFSPYAITLLPPRFSIIPETSSCVFRKSDTTSQPIPFPVAPRSRVAPFSRLTLFPSSDTFWYPTSFRSSSRSDCSGTCGFSPVISQRRMILPIVGSNAPSESFAS